MLSPTDNINRNKVFTRLCVGAVETVDGEGSETGLLTKKKGEQNSTTGINTSLTSERRATSIPSRPLTSLYVKQMLISALRCTYCVARRVSVQGSQPVLLCYRRVV